MQDLGLVGWCRLRIYFEYLLYAQSAPLAWTAVVLAGAAAPSEIQNSHQENVVAVLELSAGTSLLFITAQVLLGLLQHHECSTRNAAELRSLG